MLVILQIRFWPDAYFVYRQNCHKFYFQNKFEGVSEKKFILPDQNKEQEYKQAEWLACWKTRDPTLNAVLLFSKTCKKDAESKIQFSLISVYKKNGTYDLKVLIWVEARPLMKLI